MRKIMSKIAKITLFAFVINYFMPLYIVLAVDEIELSSCSSSNYKVSVASSNGTSSDLACYSSYDAARDTMLSYNSNVDNVAIIYHDNKIVNATYAIAKLDIKSSVSDTTNLYPSLTIDNKYTSVAGYYASDAAFIDYDESGNYKRAKIKISGYTGWVNINEIEIKPISWLGINSVKLNFNINLRDNYSTEATALDLIPAGTTVIYSETHNDDPDYLWYHVTYNGQTGWMASEKDFEEPWVTELVTGYLNTYYEAHSKGNLIHYYQSRIAGQCYTNLATYPNFMTEGNKYYSFDGNYFYTNIITMLNDYRNNTYNNSINKNTPHYSYFQYLPTRTKTSYTANDFDTIIMDKGYTSKPDSNIEYYDLDTGVKIINPIPDNLSVLVGSGELFIDGQESYGTNALLAFSAALNESGDGRNSISFVKNNIFSVGAYDSNPFGGAKTYSSIEAAISDYMSGTISHNYSHPNGYYYYGSHYGNKASGRNVYYATDPYWGEKAASNYFIIDYELLGKELYSSQIGIKQSNVVVPVQKEPNTLEENILYLMKNNYYDKQVSNMSVIILDYIHGESIDDNDIWYKIQSDLSLDENGNEVIDGTYNYETSIGYVHSSYIINTNYKPTLKVNNKSILQYEDIDLLDDVSAIDVEDGDITDNIIITGTVDNKKVGVYPIIYKIIDSNGNTVEKAISITVNPLEEPLIRNINDKQIEAGTYFDPLDGVDAVDGIDGYITDKIETSGYYDYNKEGTYKITYSVVNSDNVSTTKTMTLTVINPYEEVSGSFYLHSFDWNSNNETFDITGYLAIRNMNNTYNQTIVYDYLLEDVNTGKRYILSLDRWKQNDKYPITPVSDIGYNYTDSWFKGSIDLSDIPEGDYNAYVRARSNGKETIAIFRNLFAKTIVRKAVDSSNKGYLFRTNYYLRKMPIELFIRNNGLISKEEPPTEFDNMFNSYKTMNLITKNNNPIFSIKGVSFNIMGDYSVNQNVERKLVLENINTYERIYFDLGYVDDADIGRDKIILRVPDGKSKTRVWYNNEINFNEVPVGKYVIYIKTKAGNVDDYGELNDIAYRNIDEEISLNGKTYRLILNNEKRCRIELEIINN